MTPPKEAYPSTNVRKKPWRWSKNENRQVPGNTQNLAMDSLMKENKNKSLWWKRRPNLMTLLIKVLNRNRGNIGNNIWRFLFRKIN